MQDSTKRCRHASWPSERDAELALHRLDAGAECGQLPNQRPRVVPVARREDLDQILAGARRIPGALGGLDAPGGAGAHQHRHGALRERRRDGGALVERLATFAAEPEVDRGLDDVPAVYGEDDRASVRGDHGGYTIGQPLEEGGRLVVGGAHAVQVDVVAVEVRVDDRVGAGRRRQLAR